MIYLFIYIAIFFGLAAWGWHQIQVLKRSDPNDSGEEWAEWWE